MNISYKGRSGSMKIDSQDLLNSILESLERIEYIKAEDIPNIDLYMDQVTTFMDKKLRATVRYPGEDKILTKTMINNYAKNHLLPSPDKKRYNKEHLARFLMICVLKRVLSIAKIKTLFDDLFDKNSVRDIYEIFGGELDYTLHALTDKVPLSKPDSDDEDIMALKFAVRSFAYMIFSEFYMTNSKNEE